MMLDGHYFQVRDEKRASKMLADAFSELQILSSYATENPGMVGAKQVDCSEG